MKQKRGVGSSFGIVILVIAIMALLFSEVIAEKTQHGMTNTAFRFMVIMWSCLILLNIYCFTKILQKK